MVLEGPDLSACTCSQDAVMQTGQLADPLCSHAALPCTRPAFPRPQRPQFPSLSSIWKWFFNVLALPFPHPTPCSPLFFQSLVPLPFRCSSCDQTAPSSSDGNSPHLTAPPPPRHFLYSCVFFTFQPQATGPDTTQWTEVLLLPAVGVLIRTGCLRDGVHRCGVCSMKQ